MSIFSSFGTNKTAENDGIWVTVDKTEDGKDVRFLISRQSRTNKRFVAALDKFVEPHRYAIEREKLRPEMVEDINISAFCAGVLLNWENVIDEDGKLIDFNFENAKSLMMALPDLYDTLNIKSKSISTFKPDSAGIIAKN